MTTVYQLYSLTQLKINKTLIQPSRIIFVEYSRMHPTLGLLINPIPILLRFYHMWPLTSDLVPTRGKKVGDPFRSRSIPTPPVISGHIPTQCDACTTAVVVDEGK